MKGLVHKPPVVLHEGTGCRDNPVWVLVDLVAGIKSTNTTHKETSPFNSNQFEFMEKVAGTKSRSLQGCS